MIRLRPAAREDSGTLRAWRNLPDVRQWMFSDHLISRPEHERWFGAVLEDPSCSYWVIVLDGVDVGAVYLTGLDTKHRKCTAGLYIAEALARGRGIGRGALFLLVEKAFGDLGMNRIESDVFLQNVASLALHEGTGFRREGLRRQCVIKSGVPADVASLALLESEWRALRHGLRFQLRVEGILE